MISYYVEAFSLDTNITVKEIVVTSTKRNLHIREIPQPIECVSKESFENQNYNNPGELLNSIAGITMAKDGAWPATVNIRGFSKFNIITLVDGIRIETATEHAAGLSLFDMNDIEKIEVIKGGTSTLYGSGGIGGIVNIITKQADYNSEFYIHPTYKTQYSSVNNMFLNSLQILTGNSFWNMKTEIFTRKASNTETPDGDIPNSSFRDYGYSVNSAILLASNIELRINHQNFIGNDIGIPGANNLFPANSEVKYSEVSRNFISSEIIYSKISSLLSELSLKLHFQQILRYVENKPNVVSISSNKLIKTYSDYILPNGNHTTFGTTLQGKLNIGRESSLIIGADIWQRNLETTRKKEIRILTYNNASDTLPFKADYKIIGETPIPKAYMQNAGIFLNYRHSSDRLIYEIGARSDYVYVHNNEAWSTDYQVLNGIFTSLRTDKNKIAAKNRNDVSWSGNLGVIYKLKKELDLSVNLAKSFRAPSIEERYQYIDQGSVVKYGNTNLKPEESMFFDFGIGYWEEDLIIRSNIFANFMTNQILDILQPNTKPLIWIKQNIGESRMLGGEFQIKARILQRLFCNTTVSYVYGRDTKNDSYLPQIPPLSSKIVLNYLFNNSSDIKLDANIVAAQKNTAKDEISTKGYAIYNVYYSTKNEFLGSTKINLNLGIENIFDKSYRNHLSTLRGIVLNEPGRNFIVNLQIGIK